MDLGRKKSHRKQVTNIKSFFPLYVRNGHFLLLILIKYFLGVGVDVLHPIINFQSCRYGVNEY